MGARSPVQIASASSATGTSGPEEEMKVKKSKIFRDCSPGFPNLVATSSQKN